MKKNSENQLANFSQEVQTWESELNLIIENHFKECEGRIPVFIQKELKSVGRVFIRNFKYTALDFLLLIWGIAGQVINFIARKSIFKPTESLTENAIKSSFDRHVFHSDELDRKIRRFFKKLDTHIFEEIQKRIENGKHRKIDEKTYRKILKDAIKQTTTFPDITKLIVVESVIPIFASYYFAHKFTKGFGPVGVVFAQSYYKSHYLRWYDRWFLLPLGFKKIPSYVPLLGSIIGFTIGLVLIAPFLNAIIEIFFSHLFNPEKRIVRQLDRSKQKLLFGEQRKSRSGAIGLVFERLNMMGEVLDYVKDVVLMVR